MTSHRFTEGSTHENEKGPFRVLEIEGDSMLIEWDHGERVRTSAGLQEKIQERLEREARQQTSGKTRSTPIWMGRSFTGLQAADFQEDVTGTHWRSREQLGGAVARLLNAREPVNSWSIYRRPEIHWAAISRYGIEDAWLQAKLFLRLDQKSGIFGFYVERSSQPDDSRTDWLNFLQWLGSQDRVSWLHGLLQTMGMSIFDPYSGPEQAFSRNIDPDGANWRVAFPDGRTAIIALTGLSDYLARVPDTYWLNLVIGHRADAEALVSRGAGVASSIAACFNALLPIYESQSP